MSLKLIIEPFGEFGRFSKKATLTHLAVIEKDGCVNDILVDKASCLSHSYL